MAKPRKRKTGPVKKFRGKKVTARRVWYKPLRHPIVNSLHEIKLAGLTLKQQIAYLHGLIRKQMLSYLKKSENERITCTYSFFVWYEGGVKVAWGQPSRLQSERDIGLYLADAEHDATASFLSLQEYDPTLVGKKKGLNILRVNAVSGKVYRR